MLCEIHKPHGAEENYLLKYMENACAVVMRNENMSLTHFHLQVNCILQERAEMLVD